MKLLSRIDKPLVLLLALLVIGGAFIFASAAFGLVAQGATHISSILFGHLVLGMGLGFVALLIGTIVDYRVWKPYAPVLFGLSLVATALVFMPHIGFSHGGGTRWLSIGPFSFQPAEALKLGVILMAASYFAAMRGRTATWYYGAGGFLAILALPAVILLLQPDLGTLGIICITLFAMYVAAGARWHHATAIVVLGIATLGVLAFTTHPHAGERILTFLDPDRDSLNKSWQLEQSLIAIGSGGLSGRGFGQGVQKFTYLPEPMGDSIFAVAAEELGFIGAVSIIIAFTAFALRGLVIGTRSPDLFGALLAVGIATYLGAEAFINIASMVGMMPLTGIPLTFMSQGGSAMLISLGSAGILLNISRHKVRR